MTSSTSNRDKIGQESLNNENTTLIENLQGQLKALKSMFKVAPAGMGMLNNRVFMEVNPMVEEISGYERSELIGKNSRILYASDKDYNYVGEEKYRQIEKYGTGSVETVWKRKDGKLLDILLSSTPIDQDDLSAGVIFTAIDITERKQEKIALESSEEKLKVIFEHAPDAIYLCDLKGNFVDGNKTAELLLGYKRSELIGKNFLKLDLLTPSGLAKATKLLARNVVGLKTGPDSIKLKRKDGQQVWVEVLTFPVDIGNKKLILGIARDLTNRKKEEEYKKEQEQRMAFHVNHTPLAVIDWDLDFRVKSWNPGAEMIFGYSKEEAIGQHASFIIAQSDEELVDEVWTGLMESSGGERSSNVNKNKNGELIHCEWYNTALRNEDEEVVGAASLVLDISKRIHSQRVQKVVYNISEAVNTTSDLNRLISRIQKELSLIIDTTNFFIALYDKHNDTLSLPFFADEKDEFNSFPAGKTLTGYMIKTKEPMLLTHEEMDELERKGVIESVGSNSESWLGVPLSIEDDIVGALVVQSYTDKKAYDYTDLKMLEFVADQISLSIHRKNAELETHKALQKAKESDRLKSAFLANMSHEIRTPMNGILGFAGLLKNEDLGDEERTNYINIIEKSGKRMLGVINDLIDISKIESGNKELVLSNFNINSSLEYIYAFFKPEAEAKGLKISFSKGSSAEQMMLYSDREKVYAILINLVKNAIKYTKEGSIHFSYEVHTNTIRFIVQDTGVGIPKEKVSSIFNRFVQVDNKLSSSYEGVGLGLSITKAYVELLGGTIGVESEENKGSTFYFDIPYVKGEQAIQSNDKVNELSEEIKVKKLKILVAEDDRINQKLFSYILKEISSDLLMANNGAEALEILDKHKEVDIVLMDLKMPVMDGYEATQKIRENNRELPIIALSAFALENERKKALNNGFSSYLSKPVNKAELLKAIGEYFKV